MQHLDEGLIHAWLDGALSEEEGVRIEAHARECPECAAMIADARGLVAGATRIVSALDVVRGGVIPGGGERSSPARRSLWTRLHLTPARAALAATLLVAVSSLIAVRHDVRDRRRFEMPDARVNAAPRPAAPRPAAAIDSVVAAPQAPVARKATVPTKAAPPAAEAKRSVAPTAVANQAPSVPKVSAESLKAHDVNPATAAPRDLRLRAQGLQLSEVVTTATGATEKAALSSVSATSGFARCYAIIPDSSAALFRALPPRFAFDVTSDSSAHPVRTVTENGRVDSMLTDATWRRTSPNTARVDFPAAPPSHAASLVLAAGRRTAEASSAGLTRDVNVRPIDCRE
jgi:putative zinc finger protein